MAANDYFHDSSHLEGRRPPPQLMTSPPHDVSESDPVYSSYNASQPSPYVSPTNETPLYRPYPQSTHSSSTNFYSPGGGGREHDQNTYPDDIPLRQHPSKADSEARFTDHLPHDPTILDASSPEGRAKSRSRSRKGFFAGRIPWVVYGFTLVQCAVFIAELVKSGTLTGSPIEIHPSFNPMIGPSPYVLINMGARFVPCMRNTSQTLNETFPWPCPNTTKVEITADSPSCQLNQLCGFGDSAYTPDHPPRQWFRFIAPLFLHAGFVHIGFNMLLQLLIGRDMEKEIGSIRFFFVYLSSGIFGFVLGGNFAPEGIASTGASGALFGVIALVLLDLLYHWGERRNPWSDLIWIMVDIVISFVLGLLPSLDNFSHIGGFLMGLVLGVCILHSPDVLRRRDGADFSAYATARRSRRATDTGGFRGFIKDPFGFFKGRKMLWWAWWLVRAAALIGVLASFIVLLQNFYKANPTKCSWCKYLSCIDINHWCDVGQLEATTTTHNSRRAMSMKRNIFETEAFRR